MKIIVIGAGIGGLSTAYFLTQKGHEVYILESESEVGGLGSSFKTNGTFLEKYYHHSFSGHTALIKLMKELKIDEKYCTYPVKTGFYFENHIYPFVSPKDLLAFKPLRLSSRIRLGLTSLAMMRINNWKALEKITALEWLERYSGESACRIIWQPLLKMKFGDDHDRISATWLWNRVVDRRKSNRGREVLGYIKGGYKVLFDALSRQISLQGGKIENNVPVEKIHIKNGTTTGVTANGRLIECDIVVSTVSIPSFIKMVPSFPEGYINDLKRIKYQGSVCVILKLKKKLSDYYWINISDSNSPFVGVIEHTNFIPRNNYGNFHFVYLTKYSSSKSDIFSASDESIYKEFTAYLKNVFPDFGSEDVEKHWVFKDRFSQPVFVCHYSSIMPKIETPIKNLYFTNTAQIYPQSRSINSGIAKAREVVKEIISENEN